MRRERERKREQLRLRDCFRNDEGESSARVIVARNFNPSLASTPFPAFPFTVGALFRPGKREADKKLQNGKQRILARLSGSPAAYEAGLSFR